MSGYRDFLLQNKEDRITELSSGKKPKKGDSGKLILTNRRVLQYSRLGKDHYYKDMSLQHITSIQFSFSGIKIILFLLGLILFVVGLVLTIIGSSYNITFSIPMIVVGVIFVLISLIRHGTLKIYNYGMRPAWTFFLKGNSSLIEVQNFISKVYWARDELKSLHSKSSIQKVISQSSSAIIDTLETLISNPKQVPSVSVSSLSSQPSSYSSPSSQPSQADSFFEDDVELEDKFEIEASNNDDYISEFSSSYLSGTISNTASQAPQPNVKKDDKLEFDFSDDDLEADLEEDDKEDDFSEFSLDEDDDPFED